MDKLILIISQHQMMVVNDRDNDGNKDGNSWFIVISKIMLKEVGDY